MEIGEIISAIGKLSQDEQQSLFRHMRARLHMTPSRMKDLCEGIDRATAADYISLETAKHLLVAEGGNDSISG